MIDINQVLENTLQAIQPVAREREINLRFASTGQSFYVNTPLDEALGSVLWFILRLLYLVPKGRDIDVRTLQRDEPETGGSFLRIEIQTKGLLFNPNLIFRPDNNRFRIEHPGDNQSVVFIEFPLGPVVVLSKQEDVKQNDLGIEIAHESNRTLLGSESLFQTLKNRLEDIGNSAFIQGKLKSTRKRKDYDFLQNAINAIGKNLGDPDFDSTSLGRHLCLSKTQLFRKLKTLTGFSSANFIRHLRLQKAAELLETTEMSIGEIASAVGFNELSYFSHSFFETFQVTPTTWRKTNKNETITQ